MRAPGRQKSRFDGVGPYCILMPPLTKRVSAGAGCSAIVAKIVAPTAIVAAVPSRVQVAHAGHFRSVPCSLAGDHVQGRGAVHSKTEPHRFASHAATRTLPGWAPPVA